MTVTYTHEVATGRGFGNFWKLLGRWRGSIYKVVIPELLVYATLFGGISIFYRFYIRNEEYRKHVFEKWVKYCADYAGVIPVSFVLGFYVSQIVTRWWNQFTTIPWPDPIALLIANTFHGTDDTSRLMKRTVMRYINLAFVMTMVKISPQAKARFPTIGHLVEAGFMFPHEKKVFDRLNGRSDLPKYWVPLVWAGNIVTKARGEGRINEDFSLISILNGLSKFRSSCGDLLAYDWVCIPLVYTQVVTLAVYLYFAAALFGKQFIDDEHELDLYVPVFLFLEFFFYTGWMKVAETMANPFGDDDDDFEVNWLIDRDVIISYMLVDDIGESYPDLIKDLWWNEVFPTELPYTAASKKHKVDGYVGSASLQGIPLEGDQTLFLPPDKLRTESSVIGHGDGLPTTQLINEHNHQNDEEDTSSFSNVSRSSGSTQTPKKYASGLGNRHLFR